MSSCRPTRRTRRRSSRPAWPTGRPWTSPGTRSRSSSRPQTPPGSPRRPTWPGPASRSSPPARDVPITKYTTQVVANLAGTGGYPAGFAAAYDANVVSKEDNVKAVVAKIELGEGDAAIVYVTDAKASTKVKTIEIPAEANVPATYAGVVVKASPNAAAAHAFLTWLAGPDGQAVLAEFGFLPPS